MNVLKKQGRIKAINAACGKLKIGTEERHALQLQITGKQSLTEMALPELDDVLSHLNLIARGAQPGDEWKFVFKLVPSRQTYGKKIFRLAEKIGAMQQPPVPVMSKAYIEGIARQMRGCDQPLEFCEVDQLLKIIQALEVFVKRHGA
ncbi:MAG: regulatory protein GemA [Dechloromonas sp.]|nr:regulatory protein GemA [Dechloromonas sp.]